MIKRTQLDLFATGEDLPLFSTVPLAAEAGETMPEPEPIAAEAATLDLVTWLLNQLDNP